MFIMPPTINNWTLLYLQEIEQYTPEEMKVGLHVLFRWQKSVTSLFFHLLTRPPCSALQYATVVYALSNHIDALAVNQSLLHLHHSDSNPLYLNQSIRSTSVIYTVHMEFLKVISKLVTLISATSRSASDSSAQKCLTNSATMRPDLQVTNLSAHPMRSESSLWSLRRELFIFPPPDSMNVYCRYF